MSIDITIVDCDMGNEKKKVLATTFYGSEFVSVVAMDNIIGIQLHPDITNKYGMLFLKNFVENYWC